MNTSELTNNSTNPTITLGRHAKRHWLNVQAQEAVADAMDTDSAQLIQAINTEFEACQAVFGEEYLSGLAFLRETKLVIARNALIEAELIHREIVRNGGTDRSQGSAR